MMTDLSSAALPNPQPDLQQPAHSSAQVDLLRFTTAGSVDDGKSTPVSYTHLDVYKRQTMICTENGG